MYKKGCDRVCGFYKQEESLWFLKKKLWNKNGVCNKKINGLKEEDKGVKGHLLGLDYKKMLWDFFNLFNS